MTLLKHCPRFFPKNPFVCPKKIQVCPFRKGLPLKSYSGGWDWKPKHPTLGMGEGILRLWKQIPPTWPPDIFLFASTVIPGKKHPKNVGKWSSLIPAYQISLSLHIKSKVHWIGARHICCITMILSTLKPTRGHWTLATWRDYILTPYPYHPWKMVCLPTCNMAKLTGPKVKVPRMQIPRHQDDMTFFWGKEIPIYLGKT